MKTSEKLIKAKALRIYYIIAGKQAENYHDVTNTIEMYNSGQINENRAIKILKKIQASETQLSNWALGISSKYFNNSKTTKHKYVLDEIEKYI